MLWIALIACRDHVGVEHVFQFETERPTTLLDRRRDKVVLAWDAGGVIEVAGDERHAPTVDPIDGTAFVGVPNGFVRVDPDGTEMRIASATPIALSWHDGGVLGVLSEGSFSGFGRTENLARWTHEVSDPAGVTVAKDVWFLMSGDDTSGEIVAVDLSGQITSEIAIPVAGAGLLGSRSLFGVVLPAEVHVFAFDVD